MLARSFFSALSRNPFSYGVFRTSFSSTYWNAASFTTSNAFRMGGKAARSPLATALGFGGVGSLAALGFNFTVPINLTEPVSIAALKTENADSPKTLVASPAERETIEIGGKTHKLMTWSDRIYYNMVSSFWDVLNLGKRLSVLVAIYVGALFCTSDEITKLYIGLAYNLTSQFYTLWFVMSQVVEGNGQTYGMKKAGYRLRLRDGADWSWSKVIALAAWRDGVWVFEN